MKIRTEHYSIMRNNWFSWKVVNLQGNTVFMASKAICAMLAELLNSVYSLGLMRGRALEKGFGGQSNETSLPFDGGFAKGGFTGGCRTVSDYAPVHCDGTPYTKEERIQAAIDREDYELAAKLRDSLK